MAFRGTPMHSSRSTVLRGRPSMRREQRRSQASCTTMPRSAQVGLGREHLQPFPGPCRDGLPVVRPVRSRGVEISGVQTVVGAIQEGLILEEEP